VLNGITLIALVISIIVMLILAGVSINAIVGDNGVLTKTQYASFLNEMAAVEEAVQVWKAGEAIEANGKETKLIPANGLCKANELTNTERLVGEVGYYRIWSMSETQPTTDILSDASTFNSAFESELIFYPAGVQDLYYLNNEALGIKEDKTYLIDAATGMVYSMTGIGLKGVRCYSSNMAKAVMNGESTAPLFAEAEVSGTGSGDKLAGNVQDEFNPDGSKNENYNPYGFKIMASPNSNNIFKLYNNGDLYGKGVKGTQLNTSVEDMEKINPNIWKEFNVPSEIGSYKKIVMGASGALYFIDSNDDLWVFGNNSANNKFGLTDEQIKEYTGRDPMKVDLGGKKVSRVFGGTDYTFLITTDNNLLAAGGNANGQLGLGHKNTITTFQKVDVQNVSNINTIYCTSSSNNMNIIRYNDNTFYLAGLDDRSYFSNRNTYTNFTQIFNGVLGADIDSQINELTFDTQFVFTKNDGSMWFSGYTGYFGSNLSSETEGNFRKYNISNVEKIYSLNYENLLILINNNGKRELRGFSSGNAFGTDNYKTNISKVIQLSEKLDDEGIKECFVVNNAIYILSNTGVLYGAGEKAYLGINETSDYTTGVVQLTQGNVNTMYSSKIDTIKNGKFYYVMLEKDGKLYTTGNAGLGIMYRNNILQQNWKLVAQNVKYFEPAAALYVDTNNDLWVAGNSMLLGLGEDSKTYKNITNYMKHPDSSLAGNVKEVYYSGGVTYILTLDKKLYGTGFYNYNGGMYAPGWSDKEDKSTFVEIMSDVEFFTCMTGYDSRIIIKTDGTAYGWGRQIGGCTGNSSGYKEVPTKYTLPSEIGGVDNISVIKSYGWQRSYLITKTGKLFMSGNWYNGAYDGGHVGTGYFSQYTHNLDLDENEEIKEFSPMNDSNAIILTTNGRLYGYGSKKYLGVNNSSTEQLPTIELTSISNIEQIVAGSGWYVVITNDGKVYGTGTNIYGILGRWSGIGRGTSNSRYKTALNWVECPELEI